MGRSFVYIYRYINYGYEADFDNGRSCEWVEMLDNGEYHWFPVTKASMQWQHISLAWRILE